MRNCEDDCEIIIRKVSTCSWLALFGVRSFAMVFSHLSTFLYDCFALSTSFEMNQTRYVSLVMFKCNWTCRGFDGKKPGSPLD